MALGGGLQLAQNICPCSLSFVSTLIYPSVFQHALMSLTTSVTDDA